MKNTLTIKLLDSKKANFASVISFMFAFFIITSLVVASFTVMIDNAKQQVDLLETTSQLLEATSQDFSLNTPYYGSGRMSFVIENSGSDNLIIENENGPCWNLFLNNEFITSDNFEISAQGDARANYNSIEPNTDGFLYYYGDINFSVDNTFEVISCEGNVDSFNLAAGASSWFDDAWEKRIIVNAKNNFNQSIEEYQIEVDLDSTNLDFRDFSENDLRVAIKSNENLKLDLTFDKYSQTLKDYSKASNTVFLGNSEVVENEDPTEIVDAVVFEGIEFNGSQYVSVNADSSLNLSKARTYSMWIKYSNSGDTTQTLLSNSYNSLKIINDGGVDDDKLQFNLNVSGTLQTLLSTSTLDTTQWHLITASYDGETMKIYIDDSLDNSLSIEGSVSTSQKKLYLGSNSTNENFTGQMDEFKLFDYALSSDDVALLFNDALRYKELDFHIASFDSSLDELTIFVKTLAIGPNENVSFELYYNNFEEVESKSDLEGTFSYSVKRTIGYVVNRRIADVTGVSILSLYDNNSITIGQDSFSLDEQQGATLAVGSTDVNDEIKLKYLSNIEGNGGGVDIIAPISWASKEFAATRMAGNPDVFCMLSPFGNSSYSIYENGVLLNASYVNETGFCMDGLNLASGSNAYIFAELPILVSFAHGASGNNDARVFYPLSSGNYYGTPDRNIYFANGQTASSAIWGEGNGTRGGVSLNAYGDSNIQNLGLGDGKSYGIKFQAVGEMSFEQYRDGDGTEATTILLEKEMGKKFGSNEGMDYLTFISAHSDANCSIYSSTGTLLQTIGSSEASNGVYNYSMGNIGQDVTYTGSGWKLECDQPGNVYYESTGNDEKNLLGHPQMRQYVYPEPTLIIDNVENIISVYSSCTLDGVTKSHGQFYSFYNSTGGSCSSEVRTCNDGTYDGNVSFNNSMCTVEGGAVAFSSVWDTSIAGASGIGNVTLPIYNGGTYNFTVDWGDGSSSNITAWDDVNVTHQYGVSNNFTISITGEIVGFKFVSAGDKDKIRDITNWGPLRLGNDGTYFYGASNLDISATDELNLTGMDNFNDFFRDAVSLTTPDFSSWNTSNITLMYRTFRGASSFNGNISTWDVHNVTALRQFLDTATSFNQSLSLWNVSNVADMQETFKSTSSFDQDISSWNTSAVTRMIGMFNGATAFNQNLTTWSVNQIAAGNCAGFNTSTTSWSLANQPDMSHCI